MQPQPRPEILADQPLLAPPPRRRAAWQDDTSRHLVRAGVVGVLAGLLAVGFRWALVHAEGVRETLLAHIRSTPLGSVGWTVLPAIGLVVGSIVGWCTLRFAPSAGGSGIPHLKGVLLHLRQMRWASLLPVKFLGGVVGIGAGLSLGREGPTVQMGAAVGKMVADVLRVKQRAVPQLLSCGAGAGLAAAFNAPLAGFLFVIEELHRELSARTFAGALVAAIAADIVARALAGDMPSFAISGFPAIPLSALPIAALIGLGGGALGALFNRGLLKSSELALKNKAVPRWLHTGIACALCGVVAWWLPEAVGGGHSTAERLLSGKLAWSVGALCVLLGVKFLLTLTSYASGAPGGIFAPMLLLGALMGAVISHATQLLFPSLAPHATAFAILGMAAMFTGSVRAPLTGIVLIIEMTGNYQQLLALAVTCLLADQVGRLLGNAPVYEALLEADLKRTPTLNGESHAHVAEEARTMYVGVQRGSSLAGKSLRDSGLPRGCVVVTVERGGKEMVPSGELVLAPGDHISVLVPVSEANMAMRVAHLATGV